VFNEEKVVLAKDALNKDVDYYDIFDPRNPLNERRRQEQPNNKKTVK
jgi:peptidyl-prolyl cis-trans isomerase SDCCAG10